MGAKLIPFSPLSDEHLPEGLDGLLLYGGYPELYADRLSKNESMRMEIRRAVANGLPCIAECGGFMYLQESITDEEEYTYPMVGALKGKSYYTPSLRRFGYITLSGGAKADDMTQDGVKPDATMGSGKVFGREVGEIPAHEFHYYDSDECGSAFTAKKPLSQKNWKCIISTETLLAGYPHIHYYGNLNVVRAFLDTCENRGERMTLEQIIEGIKPIDGQAVELAKKKWNSIAKPLHSLGKLEEHIIRMAGITGTIDVKMDKKALIVMCADNGVVEEGVTQTGQEVTAIVAENFLDCNTSAAVMCKKAGVDIYPIDIGMVSDTRVPNYKVAYGTRNMVNEPAMTKEEAMQAVLTGIKLVEARKKEGYQIIATGEMGIGNTTTSSAVASVLLNRPAEVMTGRGAGLTSEGLKRKIQAIEKAIEINHPNAEDALDVLAKVGGFDLAGLAGVYLGGAYYRLPVVIDGFISAVAALAAALLCPASREYMIASHVSKEPGTQMILDELGMSASLTCDMCLGEGTGAVAFLPVLEMALEVYQKMSTFSENNIEDYEELGDK